jgi:hypothetical protein
LVKNHGGVPIRHAHLGVGGAAVNDLSGSYLVRQGSEGLGFRVQAAETSCSWCCWQCWQGLTLPGTSC